MTVMFVNDPKNKYKSRVIQQDGEIRYDLHSAAFFEFPVGLYNLICVDGMLLRCYGRSRYPRILRVRMGGRMWGVKVPVYDKSGLLLPRFWSLATL